MSYFVDLKGYILSLVRISSFVILSMSKDVLLMEEESVEFLFILSLSMCVLVISFDVFSQL